MNLFISFYAVITNSISHISSKISDKTRVKLINISTYVFLCIGTINYCNKTIKGLVHFSDWALPVSILAMLMLLFAGIDTKVNIKRIRCNKLFWLGWILCFGMMFVMSFINQVKEVYFLWSVEGIFLFPLLFLAWYPERKRRILFACLSENIVTVSYLFIIASILTVPFFKKPYDGMVSSYIGMAANPNNNGMLILTFYAASIYLLLTERKKSPLYYLLPMGVCVAISVIADCRTAELGIALQTLFGLIYYYICRAKEGKRGLQFSKVLAALLIIIAIAFVSGVVLSRFDDMNVEVHAEDESSSSETSTEELFDKLDQISAGRLRITRYYIEHSTFWGNGSPDGPIMEGVDASKWSFVNAIDILYVSGVIPFIGCILWLLASWIFILKCLRKKDKGNDDYLLTIVAFTGYFTEFMLEVTMYPSTNHLAMLAYIGLIPIACKEIKTQEISNNDR